MKASEETTVATIGMTMIGMMPAMNLGTFTRLTAKVTYPARKPARIAPRNPEPACEPYSVPVLATMPVIIPGTRPGRSAIDIAMKPARIGIIIWKAMVPICSIFHQKLPSGTTRPPEGSGDPPRERLTAMRRPPTTTKGIIGETPPIRAL